MGRQRARAAQRDRARLHSRRRRVHHRARAGRQHAAARRPPPAARRGRRVGPGRASRRTDLLVNVERDHIQRALVRAGGNKKAAAQMLGLSRRALYRRLERLDLSGTITRRRALGAPRGVVVARAGGHLWTGQNRAGAAARRGRSARCSSSTTRPASGDLMRAVAGVAAATSSRSRRTRRRRSSGWRRRRRRSRCATSACRATTACGWPSRCAASTPRPPSSWRPASRTSGPAVESLRQGVIDYLTKPFGRDRLCEAVSRGLEWHRSAWDSRRWRESLEEEMQAPARASRGGHRARSSSTPTTTLDAMLRC